jgi:hypothetical protein
MHARFLGQRLGALGSPPRFGASHGGHPPLGMKPRARAVREFDRLLITSEGIEEERD